MGGEESLAFCDDRSVLCLYVSMPLFCCDYTTKVLQALSVGGHWVMGT